MRNFNFFQHKDLDNLIILNCPIIYPLNDIQVDIFLNKITDKALEMYKIIKDFSFQNKKFLFVGTKKQLSEIVKSSAINCNSYFLTKK